MPSVNTTVRSVVEVRFNPHFRRHYTALNKTITVDALLGQKLAGLACRTIGAPGNGKSFCVEVADSAYSKPAYMRSGGRLYV